jgi:inorganic triphosphatase YgiF
MSELELKFQIPAGGREALLKAVGRRRLERVELDARYFDTADHLLARHKIALRLRRENERWVQTLKAARPHSVERLEHEVALPEGAAPEGPALALHDATEVGAQLRALLAGHGDPPLVETYRAEVVRLRRLLPYHAAVVEWSLDEGRIVAGERVHPVSELELELKEGDPQALYAMGRDWQSRHGLWLDTISKAHRGTLLATGAAFAPAVKAEPPALARGLRGDAMLRAVVAACLSQILPNAAEVAGGSIEPGHVHQLRVGLRRLRTAARELAVFAPGLREQVDASVGRVFDALGESRDGHVLATTLAPALERAGAPLARLPDEGVAALAPLVRAAAFQGELLRLLAYAEGAPEPAGDDKPLAVLRGRLDRLRRRLARDAKDFEALAFDGQHGVRKRLKRLRYLAAFAAPLFKHKRVDDWNDAAAAAQDALGRHVDAALAARRFEAAAAQDPRAWFAVGWLRGQQGESAAAGAKALRKLLRADAFW